MSLEQADESNIERPDDQNAYALVVNGNSMIEDHIQDKDYVVIKPQSTCENGDIIVAIRRIPAGEERATLKRFYREQNRVRLQPANAEREPIYISLSQWESEWQIQGKVVAIFRRSWSSSSDSAD